MIFQTISLQNKSNKLNIYNLKTKVNWKWSLKKFWIEKDSEII